jgi:hypothetical protein
MIEAWLMDRTMDNSVVGSWRPHRKDAITIAEIVGLAQLELMRRSLLLADSLQREEKELEGPLQRTRLTIRTV